jgi:hypothetical protein
MKELLDRILIHKLFSKRLNVTVPEVQTVLKCILDSPTIECDSSSEIYYCFIDPKSSAWEFRTNLDVWNENTLYVLDVMQDWTVGAIEIQCDFPPMDSMQVVELE